MAPMHILLRCVGVGVGRPPMMPLMQAEQSKEGGKQEGKTTTTLTTTTTTTHFFSQTSRRPSFFHKFPLALFPSATRSGLFPPLFLSLSHSPLSLSLSLFIHKSGLRHGRQGGGGEATIEVLS